MPGYLLDLNHVSALYQQEPKVIARAMAAGDSQLRACAITCGELEGGHQMTTSTDPARRAKYVKWFNEKFLANTIAVTKTTRTHYGEIIAAILAKYPKKNPKQKTERYLVLELGIDLNDVWQAAVALEHGLTFVTRDGMDKIREAVKGKITIENWIDDPIPSPTALQPPSSQSQTVVLTSTPLPSPSHPSTPPASTEPPQPGS